MSAIIGALRGVLSLDSAAFDTGGKRAEATMGRVERRMDQFGRKMQAHGKKLSLSVTAPLAALATVAVKSSLDTVDAQAKLAQSLDTTVKSVQVLSRAADLSGVSLGEVEQASFQLVKRLSEVAATGKGPAAAALTRLHLKAVELQKLPLDERLAAIQIAMGRYVPEAERAAVATALFGTRAGLTFTRIDTATLRTATVDVERFGVAISEVDADQIERTNDALSRLQLTGRGIANQFAAAAAPALESFADKAADIAARFAALDDKSKQAITTLVGLGAAAGPAALGLGLLLRTAAPLAPLLAGLISPAGLAVAALVALGVAGAKLLSWVGGSVTAADAHELAMDNVTIAMGDQYRATARLSEALREGGPVTIEAINQKLAEAEARRAVTAELVRERQERELEALGYYQVLEAIGQYQAQLASLRAPGDDLEQMPARIRSAYEETERVLVSLLTRQQELLASVRSQNHLTEEERANLEQIEKNIAELQRRWNSLNGITSENVQLTERGVHAAGSLAGNLGLAVGQAAALKSFLSGLPGALRGAESSIAGLKAGIAVLSGGGDAAAADVAKYRAELEASLPPLHQLQDGQRAFVRDAIEKKVQLYKQEQALSQQYRDQVTELNRVASAGGSASKSALTSLRTEIAERAKILNMTAQQRERYEAILSVQQRLGQEASKLSAQEIEGLADRLIALKDVEAGMQRVNDLQRQWSENITRIAFEGGSLGDVIKGQLKDIAFQFANTRLVLPVVASVTNVLGLDQLLLGGGLSAGGAAGGVGGGGGLLGNVLGGGGLLKAGLFGTGGLVPGVWSGLSGVFSGGGLASSFANLGGLATGASSGFGASGAALPALGILAGGIALLASGLKQEYDGRAVRGTLGPEGFDGFEFDFWDGGWIRGDKTVFHETRAEIQNQLDQVATDIRANVADMAATLGLGSDAIRNFTGEQFTIWLSGPNAGSEAEIAAALEAELAKLGDGMADLIPGISDFTRAGEGTYEALTRLGSSLLAINDTMLLLGRNAFAASLVGADSASALIDRFGGAEALNTAIATYWQAFYSDAERNAGVMRQLVATFDRMNVVMPQSRAEYRALIEAQDLNTERGRELYAQLIQLASAMDQVLPKVADFTASMAGLLGQIGDQAGSILDATRENFRASQNAAREWYRTTDVLRDVIRDLTNSELSAASEPQRLAVNRSRFQTAFELSRGGDLEAARDIPALARALLNSEMENASSALEFRRVAARIQGQVKFLAGISELEGANQDVLSTLYQQQIDVLTSLANFLQLEGLTNEQIGQLDVSIQALARDFDGTLATFDTALGDLEAAIREAELFSYDYLKERLNVAVNVLPSANIPQYLRTLIAQAEDGISAHIDFIVRSQLPAPEKWLAINSASEHIKTIDFVLRNNVSNQTRALALATGSELRRNIRFLVTKDVDAETRRIALAGNSELSRVVNVSLNRAGSDQRALMLALRGIGDYAVAVNLSFGPNMSQDIRRVVLRQSGGYAAMVQAVFTQLSGSARRVLLMQQGTYAANITGVILASVPDNIKRLLLNANTAAVRAVTIASAFASTVTPQERALLMRQGATILRSIQMSVNPLDLSPIAVKLVNQIAAGNGTTTRNIISNFHSNVDQTDARMLQQLGLGNGTTNRSIYSNFGSNVDAQDALMLRQLGFGNGVVSRGVYSNFQSNVDAQDARMLVQLGFGHGTVQRNISSFFNANPNATALRILYQLDAGNGTTGRHIYSNFTSNVDNQDALMLRQLSNGDGYIARGIEGQMWRSNFDENDYRFLDQLATNGGHIARGIEGRLWQTGWSVTDDRFLTQLAAGTGAINRIINGAVNMGALSVEQRALLASITGATQGTVTLAGTYRFAPEAAFQSWYSGTTQALIRTPMDQLRASLDALRTEYATQRQTEAAQAAQKAAAIASITGTAGAYGNQLTSNKGWAANLVAKVQDLVARTGTRLFDAQGNAATLALNPDGTINFNGAYASGGDMQAFAAEFWGTGKLNDYMARANANIGFIESKLATARRQIVSLGGVPSFDGGGWTGFGSRSGGLDGKGGFIAMLHPQETVIDHTRPNAMSGIGELIAETRALRRELNDLKGLNVRTARNTQDTADRLLVLERQT